MSKALRIFALTTILLCWSAVLCGASAFRVGDQGSDVAEIQGQLASLGYDVAADGDFGPATAEAVKAFQISRGLDADGLVGPSTYSALLGKSMPEVSRGSSALGRRIVASSMQYLGVPYVFGGTTPNGFDCSGYVRYVFANAGIYLPRTADAQYECGYPVSTAELVPGDLVFFSTYEAGASHVGIYLGDGNFINASSSRGVSIASLYSSYWGSCYIGARRVM
ncbi:MAG: NlpC/P60 family protein [Selenomonadaceae bacterium]|uniref:Glycoside hydrolase n=1 Tax=Selenomonas bovis TaxID=416586 RepID=A0A848BB33_9FIRM|nr:MULTISPECIES: NlpC/P60 family protein [Selenomonas]MBQ1617247.1 C40 family peptidase [Ruminococcus sp.]MDY6272032.1 NlpC/P60 family protein [Selenomonadaceae bacterium]MCI6085840.1 NlpC/P60 family protein [Selenomonas sp.]MCI6171819.1 NlpC/P60 family protein [Selenomonas bovis]MCI6751679.1 NlpC/P60 family protein [Selenomonas bovis]